MYITLFFLILINAQFRNGTADCPMSGRIGLALLDKAAPQGEETVRLGRVMLALLDRSDWGLVFHTLAARLSSARAPAVTIGVFGADPFVQARRAHIANFYSSLNFKLKSC